MGTINKKELSERDICTKYITPALELAGWDKHTQLREEVYLTEGRIIVRGRLTSRGKRKWADYVLYHKPNIPIAVIEAKDNKHRVGDGMQQGLEYGEMLDVPFIYSSNGDGFLEHDNMAASGKIEREIPLNAFPSPKELWQRYCSYKGIDDTNKHIFTEDYYSDPTGKTPRYYQQVGGSVYCYNGIEKHGFCFEVVSTKA